MIKLATNSVYLFFFNRVLRKVLPKEENAKVFRFYLILKKHGHGC